MTPCLTQSESNIFRTVHRHHRLWLPWHACPHLYKPLIHLFNHTGLFAVLQTGLSMMLPSAWNVLPLENSMVPDLTPSGLYSGVIYPVRPPLSILLQWPPTPWHSQYLPCFFYQHYCLLAQYQMHLHILFIICPLPLDYKHYPDREFILFFTAVSPVSRRPPVT